MPHRQGLLLLLLLLKTPADCWITGCKSSQKNQENLLQSTCCCCGRVCYQQCTLACCSAAARIGIMRHCLLAVRLAMSEVM